MATKKISDLSLRSDFDATCILPADDASQTWRVTGAQMLAYFLSTTNLTAVISALTAKTAPAVDDEVMLRDIAGSTVKKITRANLVKRSVTASKTTTYSAAATDEVIPCDASGGAFTVTLPAASGLTGRELTIKKTDTSLNAVTVDGNSTETIDGALTRTLNTQWESLTLVCDGTGWVIKGRSIPSVEVAYTPTFTGFGTVSGVVFTYRRVGDRVQIRGRFTSGTSTAVEAKVTIPSGMTIDSTKLANIQFVGMVGYSPAFDRTTYVMAEPSNTYVGFSSQGAGIFNKITGSGFCSSGETVALYAEMPISGWEG